MNINFYSVFPVLSSLFILSLGIFVFIKQNRSPINRAFFLFSAVKFMWLFCYGVSYALTDENEAFFWLRLGYTGVILIPIAFYHLVFAFLNLRLQKILILLYTVSVLFIYSLWKTNYFIEGLYKYYWGYYPKAGFLHPFYLFFLSLIVSYCYFLLFKTWLKLRKETTLYNNRFQYFFLGIIIGFLSIWDFIPNYGKEIYPFGWLFVTIYISIIAYAILRYRLLDIYLAIKRTAAYSLSAGLLTAVFAILVITATNLFSSYTNVSSLKISIVAALIIAILFNPLRNRIQILIDKLFYKKTYDYYHTIQQVSSTLASMFDMDKIFQFVANVIIESMGLKNVYLLSASPGGMFDVVYHTTSPKDKNIKKKEESEKNDKIMTINFTEVNKYYENSSEILIKDELSRIEAIHGQDFAERIQKELEAFHGEVVVPVYLDKKLSFLITLGEKMSGDIFTNEDINLLNTISVQTSIAVKNARLYQEKVNAEKLATLGMMSGTFAHEIRNPLTSLKTFAQLMPEKYNDIEFRETFSKIVVGEIEKIDGLISDLLDFSSGKKPTLINNFNLTELVDEIVDYVKGKLEFEKSKIAVEKYYNGEAIDMAGDARKLKQAFSNIIINGCQAMGNEGALRVDIKRNGNFFDVIVEDTGKGIPPENLAKIFDPFITTRERGIGLGLAISKRVIEAHNGKIQVKSQPQKGTTFTISLPVQSE